MKDALKTTKRSSVAGEATRIELLTAELDAARAEIARLTTDYEDLNMLYEATIEHGEAVEDQLAENNMLLQRTQARLQEELNDASRYIMSILPAPRGGLPRTEWLLVPSTELGGDSFGYHEIDADHFAIYLLDVCGHGVGAALLSVSVINVLRASALPQADFRSPPAVLAALNDAFPMEKQNDMFFTIWYGVYERSTGRLVYSAAGHPPAVLLRTGADGAVAPILLAAEGSMAIGAFPGMSYDINETFLRLGDRLLVVSDGTYEIEDGTGGMLSLERLADFAANGGASPAAILQWVRAFGGTGSLPDDFSLLQLEF